MTLPSPSYPGSNPARRAVDLAVALVTGRRTKWLVLVVAIVLVGIAGPLAGKLTPLENNSPTSFLPSGAQSTRVLAYEQAHAATPATPAVVVYERPGGIDPAARATIASARAAIAADHLPGAAAPTATATSGNGRAATFTVSISAATSQTRLDDDVKAIRGVVDRTATPATAAHIAPSALRVAVGGPAGSAADAVGAFAGIDGRLLLVTILIVAVLLLVTYRSPLLWLLPLISVLFAAGWSEGFAYALAKGGFVVNGMTVGILTVLVFGAGTDYALLLVARYREELARHDDHHEAVAAALRRAGPAIATSGTTVILALLCLLAASLNDVAALGPACAAGILCALVAQLALLPALLSICGRRVFWPFVPRPGTAQADGTGSGAGRGPWARFAAWLPARRRVVWTVLAGALAVCAVGLVAYRGGITQQNGFVGRVGSVAAQKILDADFPAEAASPASVLVRPPSATARVEAVARSTPGVRALGATTQLGDAEVFGAYLSGSPSSRGAEHTVVELRHRLAGAVGPGTLVGGETATNVDLAAAAAHDRAVLIPIILAVVLVMLGLLLRSIVAPVLLVATVALSYLAALGVSAPVVRYLFGFPGFDPTVPIFGFVFLVALGVDYNIFLMARIREEAASGARAGVVRGLAVTGSVITSAGVVLAATFAVLAILPLIALTEVGFVVAFGVLVDTVVVRSALVPALALDVGPEMWWPSRLVGRSREAETAQAVG